MTDLQVVDNNPFEIEINTPYSLNYLIFLQNIFYNSKNDNQENPLFPYVDSSNWGILKDEVFEDNFQECWNAAIVKNSGTDMYNHNGILGTVNMFYQLLFEDNEIGKYGYSESVKSFLAWWDGIYGKIAISKVFDDDSLNKVYSELAHSINQNETISMKSRLKIDLIYDKLLLKGLTTSSWYMVLPIEDIFIKKNRTALITDLLKCCGCEKRKA